jgi:hypothetical protein
VQCDECEDEILPGEEHLRLPGERGELTICLPCAEMLFRRVMSEPPAAE